MARRAIVEPPCDRRSSDVTGDTCALRSMASRRALGGDCARWFQEGKADSIVRFVGFNRSAVLVVAQLADLRKRAGVFDGAEFGAWNLSSESSKPRLVENFRGTRGP